MTILKWPLFAFAIICSLVSANEPHLSVGGAAAGMWIAFALFHIQDRREAIVERSKILKNPESAR